MDNTSAFPSPTGNPNQDGGLTIKDWFAGQVIGGLALTNLTHTRWHNNKAMVEEAYRIADAMLQERARLKE